jgi:hypothetical protein
MSSHFLGEHGLIFEPLCVVVCFVGRMAPEKERPSCGCGIPFLGGRYGWGNQKNGPYMLFRVYLSVSR